MADGVAVHGLESEDFEEEQVEGALYKIGGFAHDAPRRPREVHLGNRDYGTPAPLGKQGESSRRGGSNVEGRSNWWTRDSGLTRSKRETVRVVALNLNSR